MKTTTLIFISLIFCLTLPHQTHTTPVLIWSNREHELSRGSTHYLGNDLSFYSFNYQILNNIRKESPDIIFAFLTSTLTLDDLTKFGNVYTSAEEDACIHNTKSSVPDPLGPQNLSGLRSLDCITNYRTAFQDSVSNLFIDELLPGSSSILTDLKRSFIHFNDYKVVQVSSDDEFTESLNSHDKLIVLVTSSLPSLQDSLRNIDERVSSLLQIAEKRNLDYISIMLGNNKPASKVQSRYTREAVTKSSSSNSSSTLQYVVKLNGSVVLFRAQNITVCMKKICSRNETIQLTHNNTNLTSDTSNNITERYFVLSSTALQDDVISLKFIFPNGTSKSNLTSNMTLLTGYWSMMIELTLESNKSLAAPLLPPANALLVPLEFSYHCTPKLRFSILNNTVSNLTGIHVNISGLQVQPFQVAQSSSGIYAFSQADDCIGFFTLDIWMGIFACFVIFSMLYCAVMATMAISTSDRQDDPHGKPLMVEGTSQ